MQVSGTLKPKGAMKVIHRSCRCGPIPRRHSSPLAGVEDGGATPLTRRAQVRDSPMTNGWPSGLPDESESTSSIHDGTRKIVNYAWPGRSQGKPWWRSEAILTCKSIVRAEYRGERPIELSSSWFPPKFPSG